MPQFPALLFISRRRLPWRPSAALPLSLWARFRRAAGKSATTLSFAGLPLPCPRPGHKPASASIDCALPGNKKEPQTKKGPPGGGAGGRWLADCVRTVSDDVGALQSDAPAKYLFLLVGVFETRRHPEMRHLEGCI